MDSASNIRDWTGQIVDGRFPLQRWLGGSGKGGSFQTEIAGQLPQRATIKLIPADAIDAEDRLANWAAAEKLAHPGLVRMLHHGHCQIANVPLIFAVTEFGEEVLAEVLPERPLTLIEAGQMLHPALDALLYLHQNRFVHSRVKPSNFVVVNDQLKLTTDGLRRSGELSKHLPKLTVYDAPEVTTQAITAAADIWSLGITLVEALTQHAPVWDRYAKTQPQLPKLEEPFNAIVQECVRLDPSSRCTLRAIKAHLLPYPEMLPTPPKTGRSAAAKAGIGAALVAALALVGFVLVPHLHLGATTESQQAESSVATPVLRATETKPTAGQAVASATASESSPAMQASAPATEATPASAPAPVASAAPAPVVAPVTHTAQTGEVKGEVANEVLPEVLPKAQATISGTINIQVQVNVDPSGTVSGATLSSPESSKYFSKLALQAAQKWRFKPARVDGEAVASVWKLQFQFRQNGIDATPVEETP